MAEEIEVECVSIGDKPIGGYKIGHNYKLRRIKSIFYENIWRSHSPDYYIEEDIKGFRVCSFTERFVKVKDLKDLNIDDYL